MSRASRELRILLMVDLAIPPPKNGDFDDLLRLEEWRDESNLIKVLKRLGHTIEVIGVFDDIGPLFERLRREPPDLVFNLCEGFRGDRRFEPHLVDLLELSGVRYTGAPPTALRICKDKGLAKKILAYHHLRVPRFVVAQRGHSMPALEGFEYPALIKPLALEASEGIAQLSLVANQEEARERLHFVHTRLEVDAIAEEYIEGRELYVGVLGNTGGSRLQAFPPRELFFKQVPDGEPKFATYKAKWDETYRKRWGIDTGSAKGLGEALERRILETCKRVYRVFGLRGYARIDLRLKDSGEIFFIEANPNPALGREDDFAAAAERAGLTYDALIARIIALALADDGGPFAADPIA